MVTKNLMGWVAPRAADFYLNGDVSKAISSGYRFSDGSCEGAFVEETAASLEAASGVRLGQRCVRCAREVEAPVAVEYSGLRGMVLRKLFCVANSYPVSFGGEHHVYVASAIVCISGDKDSDQLWSSSLGLCIDLSLPSSGTPVTGSYVEDIVRSSLKVRDKRYKLELPESAYCSPLVEEQLLMSDAVEEVFYLSSDEELVEDVESGSTRVKDSCPAVEAVTEVVVQGETSSEFVTRLCRGWHLSCVDSGLKWHPFDPSVLLLKPLDWGSIFTGAHKFVAWSDVTAGRDLRFDSSVHSKSDLSMLRAIGRAYAEFLLAVGFLRGNLPVRLMDEAMREIKRLGVANYSPAFTSAWEACVAVALIRGSSTVLVEVQRALPLAVQPRGFDGGGWFRDKVTGLVLGDEAFRRRFSYVGGKLLALVIHIYAFKLRDPDKALLLTKDRLFIPIQRGLGAQKLGVDVVRAELFVEYLYSRYSFVGRVSSMYSRDLELHDLLADLFL